MARNLPRAALSGTILLCLLAASGCTGTDIITAGNGSVRFNITLTDDANASRFELLSFTVNQIELRPVDPEADAALGNRPLGLLTTPLQVNLAGNFFGSTPRPITAGEYVIERFNITAVQATDGDGTGSSATCAEYIDVLPSTGGISFINEQDFDPPVVLQLEANTANTININIHADNLVAALAAGYLCQQYSNCPGQTDPRTVWCPRPPGTIFLGSIFKARNTDPATQYFSFD